jgi:spore maturation protein CgeB
MQKTDDRPKIDDVGLEADTAAYTYHVHLQKMKDISTLKLSSLSL